MQRTPLCCGLAYPDAGLDRLPSRSVSGGAERQLGSDDEDLDDAEHRALANSEAMRWCGTRSMLALRSVVSVLVSFVVRKFLYERKAALRAAASGGRPGPAVQPGLPARKPSQRLGLG